MKGIFYFAGLMAIAVSSCVDVCGLSEDAGSGGSLACLELSLSVDAPESKSMIAGSSLPDGAEVGVCVMDGTGTGYYQGRDYRNVRYSCQSGKLVADKEVMLATESATMYAYYPYKEGESISSLPVNAVLQEDCLYAVSKSGLDSQNPSTVVTMRHVLSVLSFEIVKGDYQGACDVTDVFIQGGNVYAEGAYDGRNGTILSRSGAGVPIASDEGGFTLNMSGTVRNIMVIPTSYTDEAVLSVILDGNERTTTIPYFNALQGKRYHFTLTVNDDALVISDVSVSIWDDEGSLYEVLISGDTDNVIISRDVHSDGSIVLQALPVVKNLNTEVEPVSFTGTADLTQESDIETGLRTIVISGIGSDVTVNFNGTYTYDLVARYKVSSGSATQIISDSFMSGYNTANAYRILRIRKDDADVPKQESYDFGTSGTVTLKYAFQDHEVPNGIFEAVTALNDIRISDVVKSVGSSSFKATHITALDLPASVESCGDGAFMSCPYLKSVRLPDNLKEIARRMFVSCSALVDIHIPESVETFGDYAFQSNTGITSIVIPSKVKSIGDRCFYGCKNLRQIVCRPTACPTLVGESGLTFDTFTRGGVCVIPASGTSYSSMISLMEADGWTIVRL